MAAAAEERMTGGEQETAPNHQHPLQCNVPSLQLQASLLQDRSSHNPRKVQAGTRQSFCKCFQSEKSCMSLLLACKQWLKHPVNIAFTIWSALVLSLILFSCLLVAGQLNSTFPTAASRDDWIEACNQILNALFTLMALYQHPDLVHHLVLLCRWRTEDAAALKKIYCKKNAVYRSNERAQILVALVLFHIAVLSQYLISALLWWYDSENRPVKLVLACSVLGTAASVAGGLHTAYSPPGRGHDLESDEESQTTTALNDKSEQQSQGCLKSRVLLASQPQWIGGLHDCQEDPAVTFLSFSCTCCAFGWNMERLGFGNMYVHGVTLALLCVAPVWVFTMSAFHISNGVVRDAVVIAGVVLCQLGLLYGGYWRIQMRERFKLPGNSLCCGSKSVTDYMQWMFCWPCSLAQEVRTGNFYEAEDDSLYRKHPSRMEREQIDSCVVVVDHCDDTMSAPAQPLID